MARRIYFWSRLSRFSQSPWDASMEDLPAGWLRDGGRTYPNDQMTRQRRMTGYSGSSGLSHFFGWVKYK
jgi:hypothetical protein